MAVFSVGQVLTAAELNAMVTTSKFAPGNPSTTASTTAKMMGLGATITFTPALTGNITVNFSGFFGTATAAVPGTVALLYEDSATQAAPANGAGVPAGATQPTNCTSVLECVAPGSHVGFTFMPCITGLTVGHTYWFDLSLLTSASADVAGLSGLTCWIEETG